MTDSDMNQQTDSDGGQAPDTAPAAAPAEGVHFARPRAGRHQDRLLRALADMENMRKRTEREVADARVYGVSNFARDIVGVADNMHRAMQALDDDLRAKADEGTKALLEGVELTERELMNTLEKHGVKRIDPMGQKFDPNRHQAMYEIEDLSVPAGSVIQVMQSGYTIGDRVLRPALVAVAKGGAKAPPTAPASANDNPTE